MTWSPRSEAELLATIEDSTDRLTDDHRQPARHQPHPGRVRSTVQLGPVAVDEVVARALLDVPAAHVAMEIPDDLPLVLADAGLLERVVANLVDNAVAAQPAPAGPSSSRADVDGDRVRLRVRDHGPGVPARAVAARCSCRSSVSATGRRPPARASVWRSSRASATRWAPP